jgi:hypothetical protein
MAGVNCLPLIIFIEDISDSVLFNLLCRIINNYKGITTMINY